MVDDIRPELAQTLSGITASLVDESDAVTVLGLVTDACAAVLGAASTGVMVADPRGSIEVVAATDAHAMLVEVLQAQTEQGPCVDCIREDTVVLEYDLPRANLRWPRFAPAAVSAGYHAVVAVPMRLQGLAVGGLNLLYTGPPPLDPEPQWRLGLARALADLAVLALVQDRGERRADRLVEQSLRTLNARRHLSQAAGMVAAARGLDPHQARRAIRSYARRVQRRLPEVVRSITDNLVDPADVAATVSGAALTDG